MSETRFSSREARRTTNLPAPVARAVTDQLRERRRGAAEECRSKARNTPSEQQSVPKRSVSRGVTNESASSAPLRERNSNQNG